jgi:serine/arginine repetitive matrix protein 2
MNLKPIASSPMNVKIGDSIPPEHLTEEDEQPSSPDRRNRDLAQALFGLTPGTPVLTTTVTEAPDDEAVLPSSPMPGLSPRPSQSYLPGAQTGTPSSKSIASTSPSPSLAPHLDSSELAMDIQRRTEAANMALRKLPSVTKLHENGTLPRKPINIHQISTPTLQYASSSVEAIPLQSPGLTSASTPTVKGKGGFFKFRGTLRGRPSTPGPDDYSSASNGHGSPGTYTPSTPVHKQPSPPASAGPAKKSGFMSRFRKTKPTEPVYQEVERRRDVPPSIPLTAAVSAMPMPSPPTPGLDITRSAPALSNVIFTGMPKQMQELSPVDPEPPMIVGASSPGPSLVLQQPPLSHRVEEDLPYEESPPPPSMLTQDEQALKQLFDAASSLGLDQAALNEILSRSPSTKSNTTWQSSRYTSLAAHPHAAQPHGSSSDEQLHGRSSVDQSVGRPSFNGPAQFVSIHARQPTASEGRPSIDATFQPRSPVPLRTDSLRKKNAVPPATEFGARPSFDAVDERDETIVPGRRPVQSRMPTSDSMRSDTSTSQEQGKSKRNTVLRRTIIFSSDPRASTMDFNALINKGPTPKQKKRASTTSIQSGRSLVERVPTPPPPQRSGSTRRFSTDTSPPVPRLPAGLSGSSDTHPQIPMSAPPGKVSYGTAYESLYDTYSGETQHPGDSPIAGVESRPAIEVIEMANGETVWYVLHFTYRMVAYSCFVPGLWLMVSGKMRTTTLSIAEPASRPNSPSQRRARKAYSSSSRSMDEMRPRVAISPSLLAYTRRLGKKSPQASVRRPRQVGCRS